MGLNFTLSSIKTQQGQQGRKHESYFCVIKPSLHINVTYFLCYTSRFLHFLLGQDGKWAEYKRILASAFNQSVENEEQGFKRYLKNGLSRVIISQSNAQPETKTEVLIIKFKNKSNNGREGG